ncbi:MULTISPECIES: extracellular solute-binding protein [Rahnella]|jgi:arabinogalactan oligomer/maltooligosaccharide transport system substrate-binding protein|uniref:Maltodextrin-binding protein n=1 Tax=Rahnella victoriana TaxID=1510570 RepID=A0ABS0DQR7_9GAMM|nr:MULTISPECIES: extracellular solute-binding protein [Rahnella]VTQ61373.1 Cyclodextrin-binding protein precursor [Campylobacter jejuni]MBF7956241.1 extracellular solute-binding protein [Rahnella victoriana]PBI79581.1 cyclodextrin-binding protein [Rahnella victoriana]TDS88213.1 carbohydrate ABC transporter substrate-binding protein (CUT1 family) [Rahnella sp. BIGb0236]UHM89739.1 extracellular solute-binding protein [Rahnella victoriana]
MKITHLTALVLMSLSLSSQAVRAAEGQLLIWEDIKKSSGIADAVKDFEKENNVKVVVQETPYAQQTEKLRLDGPAGIGPDVVVIPNDQLGTAVVQGLLAPMTLDKAFLGSFTPSALNAFQLKGQTYGVPKAVETLVLIYNKDLLPQAPATLDEYYTFSKAERAKGKYGLLAKFDEVYYAYGAMASMGGYIFGKDAKGEINVEDIGLNKPGSIEAITYLKKFYADGLFPAGIVGDNGLNAIDSLFTEKKAAAVITGPWAFQPYEAAGINYGVKALPQLPNGKPMSSFLGVKGYAVSTYSKQKPLAEKFITFINQPKYAKVRYEVTKEIPALTVLVNDPMIKNDEKANAVAEQSTRATAMPGVPEMQEVWGPANNGIQLGVTGKQPVDAALNDAVKNIQMQIEAAKASNE